MRDKPAFVEILEYTPKRATSREDHAPIKVNQLRINGTPILCPKGESIRVHEMEFNSVGYQEDGESDLVKVTVTMWAHRVVIEQRGEPEPRET